MDPRQEYLKNELMNRLRFSIEKAPFECGHCNTYIIEEQYQVLQDGEMLRWVRCQNPNCFQPNVFFQNNRVYPAFSVCHLKEEVPQKYAEKYRKAHQILNICAEASAAASRKCLELILIEVLGAQKKNLFDKINEVKDKIPSELFEHLHCLREIGNFGAHPKKNTHTAEVLPVELEEAQFCLGLLLELFDECFVKQKQRENIKKMVDEKTKSAGKASLATS